MTIIKSERSLRIVVVDDNADILESMEMVLTALGHEATTCASGEDALETITRGLPDAAFIDASLPGISGYEVARAIRAAGVQPTPVLVAMTGWDRDEDRRRAEDSGFAIHAVKPLDLEMLRAVLDDIISRMTKPSGAEQQNAPITFPPGP